MVGNECSCQAKRTETQRMSLLAIFVNRQNSTTFSRRADARNQNKSVFFFLFGNHLLNVTSGRAECLNLKWRRDSVKHPSVDTVIVVLVCTSTG